MKHDQQPNETHQIDHNSSLMQWAHQVLTCKYQCIMTATCHHPESQALATRKTGLKQRLNEDAVHSWTHPSQTSQQKSQQAAFICVPQRYEQDGDDEQKRARPDWPHHPRGVTAGKLRGKT